MDVPVFPEAYQDSPAVRRYLKDRFGQPDLVIESMEDWLIVYTAEIRSACSPEWADISLAYLIKLDKAMGGIEKATPDQLSAYLADITLKKSPGTRNRTHNAFAKFFNWAVTTKRMRVSPIAGIKRVPEQRGVDIVYCTREEREEIIELARETGWQEWLAVPVAFFTGMRREEISNLQWNEIRMQEGTVLVAKTKTNTSRTLPLSKELEVYLRAVPEAKRTGYIVPIYGDTSFMNHDKLRVFPGNGTCPEKTAFPDYGITVKLPNIECLGFIEIVFSHPQEPAASLDNLFDVMVFGIGKQVLEPNSFAAWAAIQKRCRAGAVEGGAIHVSVFSIDVIDNPVFYRIPAVRKRLVPASKTPGAEPLHQAVTGLQKMQGLTCVAFSCLTPVFTKYATAPRCMAIFR